MLERLALGVVATALAVGCGKRETSAPHTTVLVDVRGENTSNIAAKAFADGWSVQFRRFRLSPTFGVDETFDNRKDDGYEPIVGPEGYVYGPGLLDLTDGAVTEVFYSWTIAGRSTGWGMRMPRMVAPEGEPVPATDSSLEVEGDATGPQGEIVRFSWQFAHEPSFSHCLPTGESALLLPEDDTLRVHVTLAGGALFGASLESDAELRFEALARADGDGDGTVTNDELKATALETIERQGQQYRGESSKTLHDFVGARLAYLVGPEYDCVVEPAPFPQ